MQRILIFAVLLLGLTAADAQTGGQVTDQTGGNGSSIASDPLSLPTQSLPSSGPGIGGGGAAGGSTTPAIGTGASATSSITAPASTNPQSALQLPGETADTSTDAAKVTTRAAVGGSATSSGSGGSSTSCDSVPSTDGGSANLTEAFGSTSNGC
jgi:hypothetical protein